jgi:hypothetical protein
MKEWIKGQFIVFHDYQGRRGMIWAVKDGEVPQFLCDVKSEGVNDLMVRGFWK